jgi:hypothetical protein
MTKGVVASSERFTLVGTLARADARQGSVYPTEDRLEGHSVFCANPKRVRWMNTEKERTRLKSTC